MASRETIANRALQALGVNRVSSLDEGSKNADAVKFVFDFVRDAELRTNFWSFAIKRAQLAADSETPAFGRTYQYSLPADFVRLAPQDPTYASGYSDWLREGNKILTEDAGPLNIRYVCNSVSAETYDPNFADALAARIAMEVCEELTQSAAKADRLEAKYKYFVDLARKTNGIEAGPIAPEIDEMVAVRITESTDPTLRRYEN